MPYIVGHIPPPPSDEPPAIVESPPEVTPPALEGLPEYAEASSFVQRYLGVIRNELARVEQARMELLESWFPSTAVATLPLFEQELGLPVEPPDTTLVLRRQHVVASMMSLKSDGSGLSWEAAMSAYVGSNWSYSEHIPGNDIPPEYTLLILTNYAPPLHIVQGLTATATTGAGELTPGTYYYVVTAASVYGETVICPGVAATVSEVGEVHLSWTEQDAPCIGYRVYRANEVLVGGTFGGDGTFGGSGSTFGGAEVGMGTLTYLGQVNNPTTTFVDTGLPGTDHQPPLADTSGSPLTGAIRRFARAITPAHLALELGYLQGFIVGVSLVGDVMGH